MFTTTSINKLPTTKENNDKKKDDYKNTEAYKYALTFFILFSVSIVFTPLFLILNNYEIISNQNILLVLSIICLIVSLVFASLSIHKNKTKMNKDDYEDKYYKMIDAGWIFPTTVFSIMGLFLIIIIIILAFDSMGERSGNNRPRTLR